MSSQRYSPEFKDEAIRQIIERGYSVTGVSERLGVSSHSLYKWVKALQPDKTEQNTAELVEAKSKVLRLPCFFNNKMPDHFLIGLQIAGCIGNSNEQRITLSVTAESQTGLEQYEEQHRNGQNRKNKQPAACGC